MNKLKVRPIIYALTCVILWAFIPVVARLGQMSLDNYQFLLWSSLLSFVVLFLSTLLAGKLEAFKKYSLRQLLGAAGLGFMGSFLYYLLLYFAYAHARGLEVLSLQYTWPLFVVIFSVPILQEKVSLVKMLTVLCGFAGVLLVVTQGKLANIYLDNWYVNLLVLVASATFGMFSVLSKKANYEPFTASTIFFGSATISAFVANLLYSRLSLPSTQGMLPLIINGALINGLSYVIWLKALEYGKATVVAPLVFLTPVIAAVLIVIFFQEQFLPVYLAGFLMVVVAGLFTQYDRSKV